MQDFTNSIALVTGGARGIGQAVVRKLADAGATVVFTYSSSQGPAEELASSLRAAGRAVLGVKADVRDAAAMAGLVETIEKEHGRLDVLVNNAGIIKDQLVLAMEDSDWGDVLATNLTGAYHCIKPAARLMLRKRSGSIVNVSSIAGSRPGRGHCNYAASKGGLEALTKALAVELAPKNVRVNCVAPGMIETDMSQAVRELAADKVLERIPLKRFGKPDEIADAVLFLAGPRSAYVTGAVLHVDGGACV